MTHNVLIIDDDKSFKRLLELRLKSFFPDVMITQFDSLSPAREFLKVSGAQQFDLIILDQNLPDGLGVSFLQEGWFQGLAVLTISSDTAPEIPGASVQAGSSYFLSKVQVSEPLFKPLIAGVIDRNRLQHKLNQHLIDSAVIDTVKTLVSTLRHEINNPLGAVLGAAYLLKTNPEAGSEQQEVATLVESSGKRIKHVLDELCKAIALEPVHKAKQKVFHIPGDKPWDTGE